MISCMLVAVLLSALSAITTPTAIAIVTSTADAEPFLTQTSTAAAASTTTTITTTTTPTPTISLAVVSTRKASLTGDNLHDDESGGDALTSSAIPPLFTQTSTQTHHQLPTLVKSGNSDIRTTDLLPQPLVVVVQPTNLVAPSTTRANVVEQAVDKFQTTDKHANNTAPSTTTTTTTESKNLMQPNSELDHRQQLPIERISNSNNNSKNVVEQTDVENDATRVESKQRNDNAQRITRQRKIYTNQFVIEVKGGEEEARRLAEKHGFVYLNHILGDFYHLQHSRLAKRSLDALDLSNLDTSIEEEPHVLKLERQVLKKRVKRDFLELSAPPASARSQHQQRPPPHNLQVLRPTANGAPPPPQNQANNQRPMAQFTRPANQVPGSVAQPHQYHPFVGATNNRLQASTREQLDMSSSGPMPLFVTHHHQNHTTPNQHYQMSAAPPPTAAAGGKHLRPPPPPPQLLQLQAATPPSNQQQHHHHNHTTSLHYVNESLMARAAAAPFNDPSWPLMWYLDGGARNGFDLNVQAAWQMGYTGKGIVITILDDGLEKDHPDLQANYDPLASFDINGDDADPMPRYDPNDSNRHGTRCAGEVAAVPDNNICSIGIAYNSKVGGVRMLDGDVTDAVEARSLGLNNQHIHIYSASWGPDDNGKTVDGPGELATRAFIEGVTNGRQGLGSIFVFASGNGGREHDNCNCDGYTNSIWTLSISSATENGNVPWYIEACSSTLATTYSSGSYDERQIATTDIRHSCTSNHTGTSASAPIAAGICALVLESNPRLTWRDMQHIVVRTAKPANLLAKDWRTNALGRNVSHAFGYGLMDAAAMIHLARHWTTVPVQYTCEVRSPQMDKFIPAKGYIELKLRAECANVRHLEHVQSKVTLSASRRGDLHIYLTSPHGTRSTLLAQRPNDQAEQGFRNWPFMTVHSWGESPNGIWTLEVHNDGKAANRAHLKEWTLILYGTYDDPNKHLDVVGGGSAPSHYYQATRNPQTTPTTTTTTSTTTTSTTTSTTTTTTTTPPPARVQHQQRPQMQPLPPPPPPSFVPQNHENHKRPQVVLQAATSLTQPPPPPPPLISGAQNDLMVPSAPQQQQQQQHNQDERQKENNKLALGESGVGADFEIVTVPVTSSSKGNHNLNQANQQQTTTTTMSTTTAATSETGSGGDTNQQHTSFTLKPPVQVLDGSDKLETTSTSHLQQAPNGNQKQVTILTANSKQQQQEVDANQLDLKQTKDYRSSGAHVELVTNSELTPLTMTPGTLTASGVSSGVSAGQRRVQAPGESQRTTTTTKMKDSTSGGATNCEPSVLVSFVLAMSCMVVLSVIQQHHHLLYNT